MTIQLTLRQPQLEGLALLRELDVSVLDYISKKVAEISPPPIETGVIRKIVFEKITEEVQGEKIFRQLIALYNLRRHRNLSAEDVLKGLDYAIENAGYDDRWSQDDVVKWKSLWPTLLKLLDLPNLWTVAKAVDLSYEFTNVLHIAKIITDIRPVFDKDADSIDGAVVTHAFHVYYENTNGSDSISFAIDQEDVKKIKEQCDRALKKAETASRFIKNSGKNVVVCGDGDLDES